MGKYKGAVQEAASEQITIIDRKRVFRKKESE